MSQPPESRSVPVGQAMVTFFTHTYTRLMPEESYAVPLDTLPDGLNALVQSVLAVKDQTFDFLLNDEYIATSLQKFLRRRGISSEELLNIEYTPALQVKDGSLLPHDDWVSSVRIPTSGVADVLLTGSYDHCVRLWDGDRCLALGTFHNECVKEVCVHPVLASTSTNDAHVASGSGQDRKRGRSTLLKDFNCLSCSKDGTVAAWRFSSQQETLQPLGVVKVHTDGVDSVDVSPWSGEYVASASWDCTVKVFSWSQLTDSETAPSAKAPLVSFTDHTRPVLSCRFSATQGAALLYSAGLDGNVKCLDVETAVMQRQLGGDHAVQCLAVRPGGTSDLVIAACTDNRARLYDPRASSSGVATKTFSGHKQWLYAAAWLWRSDEVESHGGNFFATASEDATVRLWDLRCTTHALLTLDRLHTDGVLDLTYAGAGTIVSCGKDNSTKSSQCTKGTELLC